jgi:hypothetical protein
MTAVGPDRTVTLDGVVLGAGALAFVASFLPWYTASFAVLGIKSSVGANAWNAGFGAWFPMLAVMAAAGAVLAGAADARWRESPLRPVVTLGLAALALLTLLLSWAGGGIGDFGGVQHSGADFGQFDLGGFVSASSGVGVGLYAGLVAAAVAVVAAVLRTLGARSRRGWTEGR